MVENSTATGAVESKEGEDSMSANLKLILPLLSLVVAGAIAWGIQGERVKVLRADLLHAREEIAERQARYHKSHHDQVERLRVDFEKITAELEDDYTRDILSTVNSMKAEHASLLTSFSHLDASTVKNSDYLTWRFGVDRDIVQLQPDAKRISYPQVMEIKDQIEQSIKNLESDISRNSNNIAYLRDVVSYLKTRDFTSRDDVPLGRIKTDSQSEPGDKFQ